jgi:hypothetical protein
MHLKPDISEISKKDIDSKLEIVAEKLPKMELTPMKMK